MRRDRPCTRRRSSWVPTTVADPIEAALGRAPPRHGLPDRRRSAGPDRRRGARRDPRRDLGEGKTTLPVILWRESRPAGERAEALALVEAAWVDAEVAAGVRASRGRRRPGRDQRPPRGPGWPPSAALADLAAPPRSRASSRRSRVTWRPGSCLATRRLGTWSQPHPTRRHPVPRQTILVIEDEEDLREVGQLQPGARGLRGRPRRAAAEGLEQGARSAPHLVLLDRMLPDLDGLELAAGCAPIVSPPDSRDHGDGEGGGERRRARTRDRRGRLRREALQPAGAGGARQGGPAPRSLREEGAARGARRGRPLLAAALDVGCSTSWPRTRAASSRASRC